MFFTHFIEASFQEIKTSSPTKDNNSFEDDDLPAVFSNSKKSKISNSNSNQCSKVLFPPEEDTPLTRRCMKTAFSNLIQLEKLALSKNDNSPLTKQPLSKKLNLQAPSSEPNVIELLDSPEDESANEEPRCKKGARQMPAMNTTKPETVLVADQSPKRITIKPNTNSNPILIEDTPPFESTGHTRKLRNINNKEIIPTKNNKETKQKQQVTSAPKDKLLLASTIINNNNVTNKSIELSINKLKNVKARVKLKKLDPEQIVTRTSYREHKVKSLSDEYVVPKTRAANNSKNKKGAKSTMNKSKSDSFILAVKKGSVENKELLDIPAISVSGGKPLLSNKNSRSCVNLPGAKHNTTNTNSTLTDDPITMLQTLRRIPDIEFMRVTRSREKSTPTKIKKESTSNPPSKEKMVIGNEQTAEATNNSVVQKLFSFDQQPLTGTYDFIIKREYSFLWKPTTLYSYLVSFYVKSIFYFFFRLLTDVA